MGNRIQLESMLKSGKWMKLTGSALCLAGVLLILLSGKEKDDRIALIIFFLLCFVCGAVVLACGIYVSRNRRNTIDRFERTGEIDALLADYNAESTVRLDKKGRAALGAEYVYALGSGRIYKYSDVVWVYITVNRQNGIPISQLLTVCCRNGKKDVLVSDKVSESGSVRLNGYISLITSRNPECMSGYSMRNSKAYKNIVREYKNTKRC